MGAMFCAALEGPFNTKAGSDLAPALRHTHHQALIEGEKEAQEGKGLWSYWSWWQVELVWLPQRSVRAGEPGGQPWSLVPPGRQTWGLVLLSASSRGSPAP